MMKEVEMDALAMPWASARVAHLLVVHRMMPIEVDDSQKEMVDMNGYDQLMYTQNAETIEPLLLSGGASEGRESLCRQMHQHHGYKHCRLRMDPCHRALLYKICTWS